MDSKRREQLLKQVNLSGFAFQLRVGDEVRLTEATHKWRVISEEHHWSDDDSGASGYIDIVLRKPSEPLYDQPVTYMVIECKRLKGPATWVFLIPDPKPKAVHQLRGLWTVMTTDPQKPFQIQWDDNRAHPETLESAFCVVQGQTDKQQPMLERLCDGLLISLECLASEVLRTETPHPGTRVAAYVPVIVTNATLATCAFDPQTVSLSEGDLPGGECEFREVSTIRFRKTLSTMISSDPARDLAHANLLSQRTVFVVNADSMKDFLQGFLWMS